jgi:hypothetical protein
MIVVVQLTLYRKMSEVIIRGTEEYGTIEAERRFIRQEFDPQHDPQYRPKQLPRKRLREHPGNPRRQQPKRQ